MACCSCSPLLRRSPALFPAASSRTFSTTSPPSHNPSSSIKPFSAADRLPHPETPAARPTYPGHVPINLFQRALLAVGSGVMGLVDTSRHGALRPSFLFVPLTARSNPTPLNLTCTSRTRHGRRSLGNDLGPRLRTRMRSTPSGRRLLRERPRITEESIDVESLGKLEEGTFGRAYYEWLRRNKVTPDTRDPVRYVDDPELAYLLQRYRESHDFYHVLLGFGVSLPAELVVKWFELANFGLPVAFLSSVLGPLRMESDERRRLWRTYGAWALQAGGKAECLIGVEWEREWETPIRELRERFGVEKPPVGFRAWREEGRRLRAEEGRI
ncbi:SPOSA6832_05121 [Sporobolomyces salmonicolor]|uniref:4-hydroxy-3-methoxy-5-polyprenylbenzoate decarboxylase n=1 Tax=Sporidiobolus salmonicolor TaxID=5005 RepID=A0A0D6ETE4_SPOSA|nr:SPOSA6832_05121 [Sporobolomyces salmonicolor]